MDWWSSMGANAVGNVLAVLFLGFVLSLATLLGRIFDIRAGLVVVLIGLLGFGGYRIYWTGKSAGEQITQAKLQPIIETLQTSVALPTPIAADTNRISINSIPSLYIRAYGDATEDREKLSSNLGIVHAQNGTSSYVLHYNLPEAGFAYAGFQFVFDDPRNLKDYQFIEVDIDFGDPETGCSLKVIDNNKGEQYSPILGPNKTFKISIQDAMGKLNVEAIKSIEFIVMNTAARDEHAFTVHDVRFIK